MTKRLFFAARVVAPWPTESFSGRVISEEERHITLAFLGNTSFSKLTEHLASFPRPPFQIGPVGSTEKWEFLPPKNPRVAALSVHWLEKRPLLDEYQATVQHWLAEGGYPVETRPFFPHITVSRSPFAAHAYEERLDPLPFFVEGIHLYESVGNLRYESLWAHHFIPPFQEIEHTADIAFHLIGETVEQLHIHAEVALAFHFPPLLSFFSRTQERDTRCRNYRAQSDGVPC